MKKVSCYIAMYICVVVLAGCATAQRGAMSRAHSGIQKGDYEFALKRLSEAEKYVEPTSDLKAEIVCCAFFARIVNWIKVRSPKIG